MREIKFRAYEKATGKVLEVIEIYFDYMEIMVIDHEDMEARPCVKGHYELMQFTGLTDINNNDVYANDIVNIHWFYFNGYEEAEEEIKNVQIHHGMLSENGVECFYIIHDDEYIPLSNLPLHSESVEVLGNIFENTELLKGNEK